MQRLSFKSPIGWISLEQEGDDITALSWAEAPHGGEPSDLLIEARDQIKAYFAGELKRFDLPLSCPSSPFQHSVLEAMFSISYGETKTYGDIAGYVEGSPQAVGRACGANPIPILIPCHRVLGAQSLGGYSGRGGVETKIFLLRLEGAAGLLI